MVPRLWAPDCSRCERPPQTRLLNSTASTATLQRALRDRLLGVALHAADGRHARDHLDHLGPKGGGEATWMQGKTGTCWRGDGASTDRASGDRT